MKQQSLNLFLIKKKYNDFAECLKEDEAIQEFEMKEGFVRDFAFYFKSTRPKALPWLSFVKNFSEFDKNLEEQLGIYAAGILFIRAEQRIFALAFGGGRHLLEPGVYESDFGLKVALNSVDHKKLRSLDAHNLEGSVLMKRMQVLNKSGLEAFGINIEKDLLNALVGKPRDEEFGTLVSGRQSLVLITKILASQLKDKCSEAYEYYSSDEYKKQFSWVDDLRPINDPTLKETLDNELIEKINDQDLSVRIFPPDIMDFQKITEFRYSFQSSGSESFFDLEIEELYDNKDDDVWTVENLKKIKLMGREQGTSSWNVDWRLYDCLSTELTYKKSTYILHLSEWYMVSDSLARSVRNHTKRIYVSSHNLPKYNKSKTEGEYCKSLHNQEINSERFVLFDRKLVKVEEANTAVEPCDLYSLDRKIYHLKKGHRSSSLSHLFSQGYVSAVCLIDSQKFRDHFNHKIAAVNGRHKIANVPDPSQYCIYYGIMSPSSKPIEEVLPFFSQLTLRQISKELKRLRYTVKLIKIDQL